MNHPNRVPFAGVLTIVSTPSDASPAGAKGHRVLLTRSAARAAMPGLIGMAVNYRPGWTGHDNRLKVGVIDSAELDGRELIVTGYLFGLDFPEVIQSATKGWTKDALGMSYELHDTRVEDMSKEIWTLTRTTFVGASILLRAKAAYRRTSFELKEPELQLAASAEGL